jgi:glycosyltransferase involved in cell wall biosynthesis
MRIAFLTPEFVTDYRHAGGLGNYLFRIGRLLLEQGHQPEVFVSSNLEPRILIHKGIRVERVSTVMEKHWPRSLKVISRIGSVGYALSLLVRALALARAMERRHREGPFDIVQSADFLAVALAVRRMKGRIHLVRCSTAADLWNNVSGTKSTGQKWRERMERATLRRADKAYAPSSFVAAHYRNRYGIPVEVLRPPSGLEVEPSINSSFGLPDRFLLHFGYLGKKTGTPWLSKALKIAFEMEPSLRMVWAGRGDFDEIAGLVDELGQHRWKVQILYPLPKPDLYSVLLRADATVLPSVVDNLPNTAIESLMLGVPIIGTRGASIDELVEDGVTGHLVCPGDVEGLALAMVEFWKGNTTVRKGFRWEGSIAAEMQPERAIQNFFRLAEVDYQGWPPCILESKYKPQSSETTSLETLTRIG